MALNPIIKSDYPDVDVIRVEDTYYMVSTTMYFFPGGAILRSYDLVHWEIVNYIFDSLDDIPAEKLLNEMNIYGKGMWAPSMRYHEGTFYVAFFSASTRKTYLFKTKDVLGKWEKSEITGERGYHDCSLFFDEGRAFLVYGNTEIWITELNKDLTAPLEGGLDRILVTDDKSKVILGYEGSHIYKVNGIYYLFMIHWPSVGNKRRTQACFMSDSLEGDFEGCDILDDDRGYLNQGVAQGGIVDTPSGKWYAILFQDSGAVGRIPVLIPMKFKDGKPVLGNDGKIPLNFSVSSTRPYYRYEPVYTSDFYEKEEFDSKNMHPAIKKQWQWNHVPDESLWCADGTKRLVLFTNRVGANMLSAVNMLTQRCMYPKCEAEVTIDGSNLNNGDIAGLGILQGMYAYIGILKEAGYYYLIKVERLESKLSDKATQYLPGTVTEKIRLKNSKITVCLKANFEKMNDRLDFFYLQDNKYMKFGDSHKLVFKLDLFTGARFGLFVLSQKKVKGYAVFENFDYRYED